jgi:uncharacterized protein (DUF1697 family)
MTAPAATTHIAMLRGINVSGHKLVKMDRLRESFEALGFGNVRTYVQSGNVVFDAKVASPAELPAKIAARIAARIARDFGFSVPVTVLTSDELGRVVKENPFLKEEGIDLSKLHVTFLSGLPPGAGLKKLSGVPAGPDRFHCRRTSVYLHCPEGYGTTKLSNNAIEKLLALGATTRNWKTVTTLHQMSLDGR